MSIIYCRLIEIVSQLAPSNCNISNDFKTIWMILNELRRTKAKKEKHKNTKTEDREKER